MYLVNKLFFGPRKSVLKQLLIDDGKNSPFTMRITKNDGTGEVISFTNNEIIDKIVLLPHDGKLKIYEVHFKDIR